MTVAPDPWLVAADFFDPPPGKLHRYYNDPVAFADDCINWPRQGGLTDYQCEILAAVPERKRVAVRGPHGLGKTMETSIAVLWFAITRDDAGVDWKVPTTASAWRQLEHYLWPEIHKWARHLRWDVLDRAPFNERTELQTLQLKLRYGSAFAVASDTPALIEGVHADAVLYVFDEAKAIPPGTFDAAEGAFSGAGGDTPLEAFALAQSTPGDPAGRFYDIHRRAPGLEDWWTRHVTLAETVAAGRVSTEWAEQRARQWGSASAIYANRVEGEFHSSDEDSVIPLSWVEAAVERWRRWDEAGRRGVGPPIDGVDVARFGSDQTVIAVRFGHVIGELRYSHLEDTMQTAGRVLGHLRSFANGGSAVVDVVGLGGGVVDRLREQDVKVVAFNAGEATDLRDSSGELGFVNKRSAAWWTMRERLDPSNDSKVALPDDDLLIGDLTAPKWRVTSRGLIAVETKDEIRKRLGRSTDSADAVIQAFWPDIDAAVMTASGSRDERLTSGRRAR